MRVLEKQIEQATIKYARKKGLTTLKLELQNDAGWPDRLFLGPHGVHFFIEFKAPGKKEQILQHYRRMNLLNMGHPCYVVDSTEEGHRIVDFYTP